MNKTKPLLLFLFSLLAATLSYAGNVVNYTIEEGLPHSEVHSFCQDRNGFIWVGTHDGLTRFDGHRFVDYSRKLADIQVGNMVFVLFADNDTIWAGTNNGVFIIDLKTNGFSKLTLESTGSNILVSDILKDGKGDYWFATYNHGIFKYEKRKNKLTTVPQLKEYVRINHIFQDSSGKMWIGTIDNGILIYDMNNGEVKKFLKNNRGATDIYEDVRGNIWIASYAPLLIQYSPTKEKIISEIPIDGFGPVNKILNVSENQLYLASINGLFIYDMDREEIVRSKISSIVSNNLNINYPLAELNK